MQVESFQEGFEVLSKSFSLVEMVKNFLHIIRGNFIVTEIYAFHKIKDIPNWKNISLQKIPDESYLTYLYDSNNPSIKYFENQQIEVSILLPLVDQSYLGILIGPKLDKSRFTELDKITLQILIQVFDSAHKSFINQKKEKSLIFGLNEKVVQLNNLIDTVIEASRYDKRSVLFELSLERITSLTNASSALLQISKEDKIEQHYSFPGNIDKNKILNSKFKLESSFTYNNLSYQFYTCRKRNTSRSY